MLFTDRGVYKKSSTAGNEENPPPNFTTKSGGPTTLSPTKDKNINIENASLPGKK